MIVFFNKNLNKIIDEKDTNSGEFWTIILSYFLAVPLNNIIQRLKENESIDIALFKGLDELSG